VPSYEFMNLPSYEYIMQHWFTDTSAKYIRPTVYSQGDVVTVR